MALSVENRQFITDLVNDIDAVEYSEKARGMLSFMEENHMKDLFGKPEVFYSALEANRLEQEALKPDLSNLVIPSFVEEQVALTKLSCAEGFSYFVLVPKGSSLQSEFDLNIVYSHGGGFMLQIKEQWDFCCMLVQKLGCTVTIPVYPLMPSAGFDEAHAYMIAVYRDVLARDFANNQVLMGDSAGGWMSVALALWARAEGLRQPQSIIPISPALDFSESDREMRLKLDAIDPMISVWGMGVLGDLWAPNYEDKKSWPPSPAYADLTGIAPIHIFVGGREVLMVDSFEFAELAAKQDIKVDVFVFEGMWHCFAAMLGFPEGERAQEQIFALIMHDCGLD